GRGSELVREDDVLGAAFSATIPAPSRTMRIAAPVAPTASGQNQKQRCITMSAERGHDSVFPDT
ncbi:hypothetical protein PSYAC_13518, partial [Pseudomonas syringae pv. actinidiae str. M302091]